MPDVQNKVSPYNPFLLDDLLKVSRKNLPARLFKSSLESMLGLRWLAKRYAKLESTATPQEFVRLCFKTLNINHVIETGHLENIPATGATIVVSNHPFGAIEGMLMADLLLQRRNDVRIMANGILKRIPELQDIFLGVNPYGHREAKYQNVSAMREALRWLKQGGLIFVFPAGDVSSIRLKKLAITDGEWDSSIARLAVMTEANVVPMHIAGYNSPAFYLAGMLHPILKTLMLPRQLINKQNSTIRLRIGKPITCKRLTESKNDDEMASYLRLRSYLLAQDKTRIKQQKDSSMPAVTTHDVIVKPIDSTLLCAELKMLPQEQLLAESGSMQVYYASAEQIPWLLQEIGRLREISFREVGEGTGKETDIDLYDSFYRHLFVWDREKNQVIGGYRLGLVDEVLQKYGRSGLYSYSLFRYSQAFLQQLGSAIELGRSFVRPEYQRNFAPLMLLWKGIGHFVALNPRYANLFGPVSISNEYNSMSQMLLIRFLKQNLFDNSLGRYVKPRRPYRIRPYAAINGQNDQTVTLEDLSGLISDIEEDEKGVPVLIRQYLKMGGKMLGFNIDPDFNDCVDGLIRVDMREADPRLLTKYMGVDGARSFLAWHAADQELAG